MEPILELVRDGRFAPERITAETATWDEAAEAVAGHRGKLVITRLAIYVKGSDPLIGGWRSGRTLRSPAPGRYLTSPPPARG